MADDGLVPYDVLLLARWKEPWPTFAPYCPMLRQGWALLELHPPALERLAKYRSELLPSLWTVFTAEGSAQIREDPPRVAMSLPVAPEHPQSGLRQRDVAILGALAAVDVDHHAGAIDVGYLEMQTLCQAQAA